MGDDSGEKTEEPTPHKLREARKKGQISKSKEFTSAVLLLASFYSLKYYAKSIWEQLDSLLRVTYSMSTIEFSPALVALVFKTSLRVFFSILTPLFVTIVLVTLIMESLQTGFLFSTEPLTPKIDNLNPINGFKKLFSLKQLVELFKSLIKMFIVIFLLYNIIKNEYFIIVQSQARNIWLISGMVGQIVIKVVTQVGIAYLILAILDYFYQKYEFIKQMRMSKKEIKEEYKRLEGDPMVKQRQRQAQREMSQGRQMGAVPGADVVVTNPVHIAIAIKYKQDRQDAPYIVAKGKRLLAEKIKAIAEENYIMIIENPPLAQALYKQTKIGQTVPAEHYQVVAEILAFVYHQRKKQQHY